MGLPVNLPLSSGGKAMVSTVNTVAFQGIEARPVTVEVQISNGLPAFTIVGLPDKAVSEARERVRSALMAIGLALPAERITVNLSPADLPKEGSHYDLAIAVALLMAMGALSSDQADQYLVMGELGLDGSVRSVAGVLPAAIQAAVMDLGLICPAAQGSEAAFAGEVEVVAAPHLMVLINHLRGEQLMAAPEPKLVDTVHDGPDMADIKGQDSAKRALVVAAAGGHNLLMVGPPGAGKSMMAARLPGLLPDMTPREALEASMVASVAGELAGGAISRARPFRAPHHSASQPALVGGGAKARPGEVSLAHGGVLFLDELPEFSRMTLEALRQPIESGQAVIARAEAHVTYPARFQLISAMNPCRCGYLSDEMMACNRAPKCALDYQSKISGPLYDRFDLTIEVEALSAMDLTLPPPTETTADLRERVVAARDRQIARYQALGSDVTVNARADGKLLEQVAELDDAGRAMMRSAVEQLRLSARGYHRVLRVARTLADMDDSANLNERHIAEALSYRRMTPQALRASA